MYYIPYNMKINNFLAGLLLISSLLFASPALAGGGAVYVNVTKTDDPLANIVRVYINPAQYTCKGINVSLSFATPEDGDRISGSDSNGSSTINSDAEYVTVNGKEYLRCSTYLKVYTAQTKLNRILNVKLNVGGESRQIAFSPGYEHEYNSSLLLPWEDISYSAPNPQPINELAPSANINAWVLRQELVEGNKRKVIVKWSAFDGFSGTFKVYVKSASNKNDWEESFDGSKGPSAEISLKANQDYHIKINGCMDKFGTCVDSNVLTLSKLQNDENKEIVLDQKPSPTPTPIVDDSKSDETLNQKVASLEAQLEQSKKEQNILAQRINDLVNFLKKIFPFFK